MGSIRVGSRVLVCVGYNRGGTAVHRPATVVHVWNNDCVNVQVMLDGSNDGDVTSSSDLGGEPRFSTMQVASGLAWLTSVVRGEGVGCFQSID